MILYRWRGVSTNFGDELNTVLWPGLLPDFFDDNPACRFLGIGSVLDQRHSPQAVKVVAGSGYGGYERKPALDENWIIHWVRGPRTAAMLGLPQALALGDPAALIPKVFSPPPPDGADVGFMPHFESAARGAWRQAAQQAGIRLIDPRSPPLAVLRSIRGCKLLLSEALHGVIVADALRVPWIAIRPRAHVHRAKWQDWADTMDVRPRFGQLPASTLSEWAGGSALGSFHPTRTWLRRREHWLAKATPERLVARAAQALRRAADADPQRSADVSLDRCQSRMLAAIDALRRQPLRGAPREAAVAPPRSHLQADGDSAYQLTPIV
ncbi:MAG TPA: polysaccharide pyruvyl transferase family protein [Rhodopila sp.]|nr:polysaccharide pyruvyl transferase family protein [Rhodopila sp.]